MTTGIFAPPIDGDLGFMEEIKQFSDIFTGQRDAGAMSLLGPLPTPAAPSVTTQSGAITGTGYQWGIYWITGIQYKNQAATLLENIVGRTPYGSLSGAQSLTAKQATVSISGLTPPTGAIGWGVVRNKSAGGTWYIVPNSEQFLTSSGLMPATFVDNIVDSSLVTTGPTVNTTGTSLYGGRAAAVITLAVTQSLTNAALTSIVFPQAYVWTAASGQQWAVRGGPGATVAVPEAGVWLAFATIQYALSAAGTYRSAALVHSSALSNSDWALYPGQPSSTTAPAYSIAGIYQLNAGDTVSLQGDQDSGGALNVVNAGLGLVRVV